MEKKDKNKKIISLSIVLFIVMLLVSGGSYAYWTWITNTSERTNVALTITAPDMTATLTGYTQTVSNLIPVSSCTDSTYAIKKQLTLTYENLSTNAGTIKGTLSIENFVSPNGTPDSDDLSHLHYAVTKSGDSCTTDVIRGGYGTFTGTSGSLFTDITLKGAIPAGTEETSSTYYLWVWLDADYTHQNVGSGVTNDPMQNISFNLVWTGTLLNDGAEPEQPVLDEGMIPVTIANNGTVTTIAEYDLDWYDYTNKEWANVVLVDSDSRSAYKGTSGKTVTQSDILAYYTWIPRYSYKIPEMTCSEIANPNEDEYPTCYKASISSEDKTLLVNWWYAMMEMLLEDAGIEEVYTLENASTDIETALNTGSVYVEVAGASISFLEIVSMYNEENDPDIVYETTFSATNKVNAPRTIDISFESKNASALTGDAVNTYRTHPAFMWDGETKSGIWVGKFEATGDGTTPTVLPNTSSLRSQNVSTQFITSLKFAGGTLSNGIVSFTGNNTYGLTTKTDSHMMKNNEWGAVAYLSHSLYGINYEIRINNYWNNGPKTGCGASEENGAQSTSCEIAYGGATSYPQSTTGNITGIFDMSGGAWEYTMGVLADDSGNPRSGNSIDWNSGFNGLVYDGSSYTSGITFPSSKYYDLYTTQSSLTACNGGICYGHALSETSMWYNDYAHVVYSGTPWFVRGGNYDNGAGAGAFVASYDFGDASFTYSWRSVLVAE